MKRDRLCYAVHGEVANNVAALRSRLFYAATFERDLWKSLDIKKFLAAQMIVSLFDVGVDAAHVDLRRYRGILRMLAFDVDLAIELGESSLSRAQELMHTKTDRRARWIELVSLGQRYSWTQASDYDYRDKIA